MSERIKEKKESVRCGKKFGLLVVNYVINGSLSHYSVRVSDFRYKSSQFIERDTK